MPFRKSYADTNTHKSSHSYRHVPAIKKDQDLTQGPLFTRMLLFILPLMVTNLLQVFYNAADMIVVSLSSEPDAVAAIGTTGAFVNLIVNVFIGFATGANVMVARHLGSQDEERTARTTHTALTMSVIFGLGCSAVGLFISRPVLILMGTQGKLLDLATTYTIIYFIGVPFISMTNYLIAIFRAKGDTRTPLYILSASGLVNVLLNLFFVMIVDLSVEGVAIATVIANAVSALLLLLKLSRDHTACRFSWKKLCLDKKAFHDILYVGLPAGIHGSLISLANLIIQSAILQVNNALYPPDSLFSPVVKGNAAAANLEGFIYTAQSSVYQAAITFTSQHVGAKKLQRIKKIMGWSYLLGFMVTLIVSLSLFLLRTPLLSLYGVRPGAADSLEQGAYLAAVTRMCFTFLPYVLVSFRDVGCGILRGQGRAITATLISLVGECVFRIFWVLTIFQAVQSLASIYICLPISWGLTGLCSFGFVWRTLKKMIAKQKQEQARDATQSQQEKTPAVV